MRLKEPSTTDKVKDAAASAAAIAAEKTATLKEKAVNDIAPAIADQAAAAREAAAPHVEHALEVADKKTEGARKAAAPHIEHAREVIEEKAAEVQEKAEDARKDAEKRRDEALKQADKKRKKANKAADKKAKKVSKIADKKAKKADKKVSAFKSKAEKKGTKQFGPQAREEVAYRAASLKGQAQAIADDHDLSVDKARDSVKDEFDRFKELLAAATAATAAASANAVGHLPEGAQKQVAQVAPQLAPKKKKGGFLIVAGLGALAGAGYLYYTEQQKRQGSTQARQFSETAVSGSQAHTTDGRAGTPVVGTKDDVDGHTLNISSPAGGDGTAAKWNDTNHDGKITSADLEGQTGTTGDAPTGRHAARDE